MGSHDGRSLERDARPARRGRGDQAWGRATTGRAAASSLAPPLRATPVSSLLPRPTVPSPPSDAQIRGGTHDWSMSGGAEPYMMLAPELCRRSSAGENGGAPLPSAPKSAYDRAAAGSAAAMALGRRTGRGGGGAGGAREGRAEGSLGWGLSCQGGDGGGGARVEVEEQRESNTARPARSAKLVARRRSSASAGHPKPAGTTIDNDLSRRRLADGRGTRGRRDSRQRLGSRDGRTSKSAHRHAQQRGRAGGALIGAARASEGARRGRSVWPTSRWRARLATTPLGDQTFIEKGAVKG